jgi:hypothetical protein
MSTTTEYLMFWDATMSNPNGDMLGSVAKNISAIPNLK